MTAGSAPLRSPTGDRELLSSMRSLLVLGKLMTDGADEQQILQLATTAAPSIARCQVATVVRAGDERDEALRAQAGVTTGPVDLPDVPDAWAFPLTSHDGHLGHLVVGGAPDLSTEAQFLLRALAQQTGGALANQRLHAQEQATATTLSALNDRLRGTVTALQRSMEIHARLTAVAASGEGREGIARAVHELTGLQVAIEDRHGNLQAWAGPHRPDLYPKDTSVRRERLVARAGREAHPLRHGDQVLAVAHPQGDTLGVIVLHDPDQRAGDQELMALEHGATILAMELARVRSLAESELRLRRDVVDELLDGADEQSTLDRALALGYDLQRPHRVVVVEGQGVDRTGSVGDEDALFQAVRRAAREGAAGQPGRGPSRRGGAAGRRRARVGDAAARRAARARRPRPCSHGSRRTLRRGARLPALLPAGPARAAPARASRRGTTPPSASTTSACTGCWSASRTSARWSASCSSGSAPCSSTTPGAARSSSGPWPTTSSAGATTSSPRSRSSCTATR